MRKKHIVLINVTVFFLSLCLLTLSLCLNLSEACVYYMFPSNSKLLLIFILRYTSLFLIISLVLFDVLHIIGKKVNLKGIIIYITVFIFGIVITVLSYSSDFYNNSEVKSFKPDKNIITYFPYYHDFNNKTTYIYDINMFSYSKYELYGNKYIFVSEQGSQNDDSLYYVAEYFKSPSKLMIMQFNYQTEIPNGNEIDINGKKCIVDQSDEYYKLFIYENNECYRFELTGDGFEHLKSHEEEFNKKAIEVFKNCQESFSK